jgi:hypothetical protein
VAGNAYYDPSCDLIAYDRALLEELSTDYGRFLAPVVMAHEFGHAMQGRFGFTANGRSIQDETQADCFAGAWTGWVAAGKAEHVSLRRPELDDVIRGFLLLRDDIGSDPADSQAHGSYFDRVSAFYEGFDGGVGRCRDDFGADRLYTAATFANDTEYASQGNAAFDDIVSWVGTTLPEFWSGVFPTAFGRDFTAPSVKGFDGTAPDCVGRHQSGRHRRGCAVPARVRRPEPGLPEDLRIRLRAGRRIPDRLPRGRRRLRPGALTRDPGTRPVPSGCAPASGG